MVHTPAAATVATVGGRLVGRHPSTWPGTSGDLLCPGAEGHKCAWQQLPPGAGVRYDAGVSLVLDAILNDVSGVARDDLWMEVRTAWRRTPPAQPALAGVFHMRSDEPFLARPYYTFTVPARAPRPMVPWDGVALRGNGSGGGAVVWTRLHSHAALLREARVYRGSPAALGLGHSPGAHDDDGRAAAVLQDVAPLCTFAPRTESVGGVAYDRVPAAGAGAAGTGAAHSRDGGGCTFDFAATDPQWGVTTVAWLRGNPTAAPFHMHVTLAFVLAAEAPPR